MHTTAFCSKWILARTHGYLIAKLFKLMVVLAMCNNQFYELQQKWFFKDIITALLTHCGQYRYCFQLVNNGLNHDNFREYAIYGQHGDKQLPLFRITYFK
jgi:hypothetical protein